MKEPAIIVITGPPGGGKSTVAGHVADRYERSILLNGDSFFGSIRKGWLPPWTAAAHEQNRTALRAIAAAGDVYASSGYTVVVDGIIGPWFLEEFASQIHHPVHYIVLRPSAEVALGRGTGRGQPALVEEEPITQTYDTFRDLGEFESAVIDSTDQDSDTTVAAVMAKLMADGPLLAAQSSAQPILPTAAGALFQDERGHYLIVEPTYKPTWEIPGGTALPGETPAEACRREVSEELGLEVAVTELLCVDYVKPPAAQWEGLRFVFAGGRLGEADIESIVLNTDELRSYAFVAAEDLGRYVSAPLLRRLEAVLTSATAIYLEDGTSSPS